MQRNDHQAPTRLGLYKGEGGGNPWLIGFSQQGFSTLTQFGSRFYADDYNRDGITDVLRMLVNPTVLGNPVHGVLVQWTDGRTNYSPNNVSIVATIPNIYDLRYTEMADMNRDGYLDIVVPSARLLLAGPPLPITQLTTVAYLGPDFNTELHFGTENLAVDFNSDMQFLFAATGRRDVKRAYVFDWGTLQMSVVGNGTLEPVNSAYFSRLPSTTSRSTSQISVLDYNQDGRDDFAFCRKRLFVYCFILDGNDETLNTSLGTISQTSINPEGSNLELLFDKGERWNALGGQSVNL